MKRIPCLIPLLIVFSCKAQNQVADISELGLENTTGTYYMDTQNLLNPFEGTYIYQEGNTILKIVLQKKLMSSINNRYYEDIIIGEYQYIDNGIEKVNTLQKLTANYSDQSLHSITGNEIITKTTGCGDCEPNEKGLGGGMVDYISDDVALIKIRRIIVNSAPAIQLFIWWQAKSHKDGTPLIPTNIPGGYYTLMKQ